MVGSKARQWKGAGLTRQRGTLSLCWVCFSTETAQEAFAAVRRQRSLVVFLSPFFFCRSLPFDPSFSCPHRGCVLFTSQGSCSYQRGFLAANHPAASANQNVPLIFRATNSNSGRHVFLAVTLQHSNRHRTQNHYAFHQSRQYYLLVRSKLVRKEARLRVQRETLRCIAAALYLSVQAASQCLVSHQPCLILQKTKGRFSFSEQEPTSTAFLNEWRVWQRAKHLFIETVSTIKQTSDNMSVTASPCCSLCSFVCFTNICCQIACICTIPRSRHVSEKEMREEGWGMR